jgi:hypothetical protein
MLKTSTLLKTWPAACFSTVRQRVNNKTLSVVVTLILLLLFGDILLPLLGHVLHVLIEIIDSALEHFLESAFHLSKRQSQIILFYSELVIGITVFRYLLRKAYVAVLQEYAIVRANWFSKPIPVRFAAFIRAIFMLGALSATLLMFT